MPVGHLYVFFGKMSIWILCSFFNQVVCFCVVVELYEFFKGDSSRFKDSILTWDAAGRQVDTGTEAKSKQVRCLYGLAWRPHCWNHHYAQHTPGNGTLCRRQGEIQEERNRAHMLHELQLPKTLKENACKREVNKCTQETRSMRDKLL